MPKSKTYCTKKHQAGFGVLEVFTLVIAIAILGTVGWAVYSHQQNNSEPMAPEKQSTSEVDKTETSYLTVEEWGVKIPQPEGMEIEYEINPRYDDTAYFVSTEFKALGGNCGESGFIPYGITWRSRDYVPVDEVERASLDNASENNRAVEIDEKIYYIYDMRNSVCNIELIPQEGSAMSVQEQAAGENLLSALRGMTAD